MTKVSEKGRILMLVELGFINYPLLLWEQSRMEVGVVKDGNIEMNCSCKGLLSKNGTIIYLVFIEVAYIS